MWCPHKLRGVCVVRWMSVLNERPVGFRVVLWPQARLQDLHDKKSQSPQTAWWNCGLDVCQKQVLSRPHLPAFSHPRILSRPVLFFLREEEPNFPTNLFKSHLTRLWPVRCSKFCNHSHPYLVPISPWLFPDVRGKTRLAMQDYEYIVWMKGLLLVCCRCLFVLFYLSVCLSRFIFHPCMYRCFLCVSVHLQVCASWGVHGCVWLACLADGLSLYMLPSVQELQLWAECVYVLLGCSDGWASWSSQWRLQEERRTMTSLPFNWLQPTNQSTHSHTQ